jgi:hypothetical protein
MLLFIVAFGGAQFMSMWTILPSILAFGCTRAQGTDDNTAFTGSVDGLAPPPINQLSGAATTNTVEQIPASVLD